MGELLIAPTGFTSQRNESGLWVEVAPRATLRVEVLRPAYVLLALSLPFRLRAPQFSFTDRTGDSHLALDPSRVGMQGDLAIGIEF